MAIYEFFTSRNNGANVATYVGQAGRLFYDGATGVLKISDGTTPGGVSVQLPVATTTLRGGIKAGLGANVSADGTLTINTAGLPLSIGNLQINNTTIKVVTANDDLILESSGTGNVELVGNVHFHTTTSLQGGLPYFEANSDGQLTVRVPVTDLTAGAFKLIGSASGFAYPPINAGVMLHVTGNNNEASRIYNDGISNFAAFVGRRINGTVQVPTAVQAGDEIIRISSTGHNGVSIPGGGGGRIVFQAKETYTTSAQGTNLSIWTTAIGSNVLVKTATFDRETGLTIDGNVTAANLNIAAGGTITTPTVTFNDGGIRLLGSGGATVNINLSTDSIVHFVQSQNTIINLQNPQAGRIVKVIMQVGATAYTLNTGVSSVQNSTTGTTTFGVGGGGGINNQQAIVMEYISTNTAVTGTFMSITYK